MTDLYPVRCPGCAAEFDPSSGTWWLCLDCGRVFGPFDARRRMHKAGGHCVDGLGAWDMHADEEAARAAQESWIEQRRV